MATDRISEILSQTTLFGGLPDDALETIARGCEVQKFGKGEWVFRQGDPTHEMFIVVAGRFLRLISEDDQGYDRELGEKGPGEHFGEVGILEEGGRIVSVLAQTDGEVIKLPRESLLDALQLHPKIGLELCRGFIHYIQQSRDAILAIPFVDLDEEEESLAETLPLLSPRISIACRAVVIDRQGDVLTVGMVDPYDQFSRDFVREALEGFRVEIAAIGQDSFDRVAAAFLKPGLGGRKLSSLAGPLEYLDAESRPTSFGDDPEGELLQSLLTQAITSGSSDVHFDPHTRHHRIRMRIDGSLFTVKEGIDDRAFRRLIARVKAMSQLDVANRFVPEDGRFVLVAETEQIEVRVSTMPCLGGEKAALRIIDPTRSRRDLNSLFVSGEIEQMSRNMLLNSSGLALVVGPTGSGKTTTLYAALNALWERTKTINIVTIENPIEYELSFATQSQVSPAFDLNFEKLLRHSLRQDPDVMLVGEIRGDESAAIATEAAVTGHLVLSSLHTDSALDAIIRLRQLGVPAYLLASCLRGVIAQRLVPQVCASCEEEIPADDESVTEAVRMGILESESESEAPAGLRRGRGCDQCRQTGESGRVGVFELLLVNDHLRSLIEKGTGTHEIRQELNRTEFFPMKEYAGLLLKKGLVSPERALELFPRTEIREA